MRLESRKWFDYAYDLTSGLIPFGFVTGKIEKNDIKRLLEKTGVTLGRVELSQILETTKKLYEKLPPEEDFKEEKEAILQNLVPYLREKFYFVDTAILFGNVMGDIDIGLIAKGGISNEEFYSAIYPGCDSIKKYPIVDWDSLYHFRSYDGEDLAAKIIGSRLISNQIDSLDPEEIEYIRDTVYKARSIWGNPNELSAMRSYFERIAAQVPSSETV